MRTLEIGANDAGQRLDKFLGKHFKTMPKSLMYKYIRKKCIKVNGKKCDIDTRLQKGDVLTFYIKDEFFEQRSDTYDFMKAPVKLDIIYEDDHIMLLNKKPGLIVHPDENYHFDSLIARVQHYLYEKGEYDPKDEQSFAPALVNRIDRNTGGIVIAAKTAEALRVLNQKLRDRELEKYYLCAAVGSFRKKEDLLVDYLEKNEKQNRVYISPRPTPDSKTIKTKYRVLCENNGLSLLEVDLLTGRTHQIRAHMAYISHPLVGDGKYGKNEINRRLGQKWQALYSYKLKFNFTTDAGALSYLDGKCFTAPEVWFVREWFGQVSL